MSSTNRGKPRRLDDEYETPPELAELICKSLKEWLVIEPRTILEPGCGSGSFLDAFPKVWPDALSLGVDINPHLLALAHERGHDVAEIDVLHPAFRRFDLVCGNPPFKFAERFIRIGLDHLNEQGHLAFLLRLNLLGGRSRYDTLWSKIQPRAIYVLPARPGFTADGRMDSIEYMVAVFQEGFQGSAEVGFIDNREIANAWPRPILRAIEKREPPDAIQVLGARE